MLSLTEMKKESAHDALQSECRDHLSEKRFELAFKRLFDITTAAVALVVFAPIFVLIAVAIAVSSPGPAIFRQRREGFRRQDFMMLKFRSMKVKHDVEIAAAQQVAAAQGTLLKLRHDPRITRVGRILRSTSLDELPQLINVLKGEMSLVGPRPLVPFMLEPCPEFRELRALVRPGISGLWQIRDRENNTSAFAMMSHDLEYIRDFSLRLDFAILFRTVGAVLARKGAC